MESAQGPPPEPETTEKVESEVEQEGELYDGGEIPRVPPPESDESSES